MVKKLQGLVAEEADLFNIEKPLVIVDAGIATRGNLALLRDQGFEYLVNDSRKGHAVYHEAFAGDGFAAIENREQKTPVAVKMIQDPENESDWLVLCRSDGRKAKESAMRSRAEERFLDDLRQLSLRVEKKRLKDRKKIERAIGRLQGKHRRVARFYTVELQGEAALFLSWCRNDERYTADAELHGCYVLRTCRPDASASQLWGLYMMLTRAEDGFRALKSDLGLRPNRHRIEERVDAHVFISVLAYHLLQYICYRLEQQGDTRSWTTIKRVLETHNYATVVIPTKNQGTCRIRKAGTPDEDQKAIYKILDIDWRGLPVRKMQTPPGSGYAIL